MADITNIRKCKKIHKKILKKLKITTFKNDRGFDPSSKSAMKVVINSKAIMVTAEH